MAIEIEIRPATSSDTESIIDLVRTSLGTGTIPRERSYWEWKHFRNPFGESPMLVAEASGIIVGLRTFMRWEWRLGNQIVPAVRAVDTATHPEWQGRGIFRQLTEKLVERMRQEGISFIFNTPNDQSRPGYLKMGWTAVGRTDLWIRPLHPLRMARALAARNGATPPSGEPDEGPFEPAGEVLSRSSVRAFLERVPTPPPSDRLATPRTFSYLQWRYADIPGFRYSAAASTDGEEGAVVFFRSRRRAGVRELRICDLIVGPTASSREAARDLLHLLHKESTADFVAAMSTPGSREQTLLVRSGFVPAPRLGPTLTVRPLNMPPSNGVNPLLRSSWAASIGDIELF